jgi:cob(I)alamin adenosyltransferase
MLARAAEEQLDEQRELAHAMGEIRNQLMRMGQELAELRVRPRDESVDAQINHVTVEMREAVRFLSERLDGVTRMVAQRGEDLADIRTALSAVDGHVRAQAETIGVLSAGLQALPSYGERVSSLQDNVQAVHEQLAGIGERLAATDGADRYTERLDSIESTLAPLAEQIEAAGEIGTAQSGMLSQLQSSASQLQQAVERLNDRLDPIAADLTALGGQVAGLVEGTAAGAALDSRISESVGDAVLVTERRLTEHVDEAVLALAQTLLQHRVTAASSHPAAVSAASSDSDESEGADLGWWSSTELPDDPQTSVWRKGDDLATDGAQDADEPDDEEFAADPDDAAAASPAAETAGDEEMELPSFAALASEADGPEPAESHGEITEPWTPETPPSRPDDDPTGPLPSKRRRRWGRH